MKASRFQSTTRRAAHLLCLGFLTVGFASCAHLNEDPLSELSSDPLLGPKAVQEAPEAAKVEQETPTDQGSAKSIAGIPLPVNSDEGGVVANHLQVRQVSAPPQTEQSDDTAENDAATNPQEEGENISPEGGSAEWCPPEGHFLLDQFPQGFCPPGFTGNGMGMHGMRAGFSLFPPVVPGWIGGAAIPPNPQHFPDEYLCDGGDRGYPVRYDFNMRLGLETEDTIAEYTDHTGDTHVKPTNKVCVYAPRFGAMRSVSSPVLGTKVDQLASADKFLRGAGMRNRDVTGIHKQHMAAGHYHMRERASNFEMELRSSAVDQSQILASHTKLINTFEDLQFVRSGTLVQTDEVRLAKGVQAAAAWTRTQFPVIAAQTDQAQEVVGEFRAQEIVGKEDKRRPGKLRIVKLADKDVAQPGETITFTIRYDNVGERELYEIRIIDNLTPRLQYVEDSETSTRTGELLLQDNEEGSLILEFRLDQPLPAGEGGVVSFQAKVR